MFNFIFHNPTRVLFGKGSVNQISGEIPKDARVLITYGGDSARRYGVLEQVKAVLSGYDITEFGGIEPNPEYETLLQGVSIA
ncbi:MAG: NADH-dependent alcohol dehydrogenase, partial [Deltaproteobacteria bacterium HGW-Deltaproteobacteria-7]